ncbi:MULTISPECIES: hypothetical protein [Microbispora]|uniref:Uncharacterized protein n=1 Tax=Microbispora siamensis TaxID=564413 RepID=A0ABQ4GSU5_9ACTN|nr:MULTISPECIES: hypothetical protein [Microbispora]GIH64458.1 hypothetical protein Msi02_52750 [Microbispora siamensis]
MANDGRRNTTTRGLSLNHNEVVLEDGKDLNHSEVVLQDGSNLNHNESLIG